MYPHLMGGLWPSSIEQVQRAGVPTEPQAILVYALLLVAVWAVWLGNRSSGEPADRGVDTPSEAGDQNADAAPKASRTTPRKRKNKAKRRRQGHIDWIQ